MPIEVDIIDELESNIRSAVEALRVDLSRLRTGRANLSILDGVRVDYYGNPTPLNQCANLNVADARLITVKPWDKSIIQEIEKAITKADIGINPQSDGEIIRLPIPSLTEERRKELAKGAKSRGEDAKISIRNSRRDANEMLKDAEKEKEITEDELERALATVQDATDSGTKQVEEVLDSKEKEILEI